MPHTGPKVVRASTLTAKLLGPQGAVRFRRTGMAESRKQTTARLCEAAKNGDVDELRELLAATSPVPTVCVYLSLPLSECSFLSFPLPFAQVIVHECVHARESEWMSDKGERERARHSPPILSNVHQ
jgi:hypothetical protein